MSGGNKKRVRYIRYKNLVLCKHTCLYLYSTANSKKMSMSS